MNTCQVIKSLIGGALLLSVSVSGWSQPKSKDAEKNGVRDTLPPIITVKDTLPPIITVKDQALTRAYRSAFKEVKSAMGSKEAKTMSKAKTKEALIKTIDGLALRCPKCSHLKQLKKQLK